MTAGRDPFLRRRVQGRLARFRVQLLVVLGLVAVGALVWLVYFSSVLGVRDVEVSGTGLLTPAEVEDAAAVEPGTALARLDLDAIGARVEELDPVAAVEVERRWPSGLSIRVTERTAVAVVRQSGTLSGMDAEGVLFRSYDRLPRALPLVDAGALAVSGRDAALAEVATALAALDTDVVRRVDHVQVASRDAIVLVLDGGAPVTWGSAEDSELKAQVLSVLLEEEASAYDVSVPGQPTTRQ
jgi:cell division septal protein FtsQ